MSNFDFAADPLPPAPARADPLPILGLPQVTNWGAPEAAPPPLEPEVVRPQGGAVMRDTGYTLRTRGEAMERAVRAAANREYIGGLEAEAVGEDRDPWNQVRAMRCPKCGSPRGFNGPVWGRPTPPGALLGPPPMDSNPENDFLYFTCYQCGYAHKVKPLDAPADFTIREGDETTR